MKSFEDDRVLRQPLTPALLSTVRVIGEFKGKQDMWNERFPEVLKQLQEVAIIQSTESSNAIGAEAGTAFVRAGAEAEQGGIG